MTIADDIIALPPAIEARLASVLNPVGADVIVGEIGDGQEFPRLPSGEIKPVAFLVISVPADPPLRMRGITGVRDDQMVVDFSVLCVGPSESTVNSLVAMVIFALRGYRPTVGSGEIECFGSAGRAVAALMHPARYAKTVGFGMSIGALVVA